MAQVAYRANLLAKSFPFLSEYMGRSIIVPQYDNQFVPRQNISNQQDTNEDSNVGIPQIYYAHNVMPHQHGLQSIGYTTVLNAATGTASFTQLFLLRDSTDAKVYLGVKSNGDFWINDGTGWVYISTYSAGANVTIAYVSGVTYIYVANYGCLVYNFITKAFTPTDLTGLTASTVLGICPSYGYLIAWTSTTVAWSSTITPTDFTPSLVTGAGGGSVESARGAINICVPHTLGFIVYTTANAVAALYQANARFPFQYREIVNSGGVNSRSQVTYDANTASHYVYSTSGVQMVSTQQTQTVFPEITDFISGRYFEDFDDITNTFNTIILNTGMQKQISMVADRYLVVSYGISALTHAIVWDISNKRYGKLKIPHVECFEYELQTPGIVEIPRQSLAFLQADGTVKVVDFSVNSSNANGTLILGKYQFVRTRLLQLDIIELENVVASNTFNLSILTSLDGKNNVASTPNLLPSVGLSRKYGCRAIGVNHSLLFQGGWTLISLVLTFNIHGKR